MCISRRFNVAFFIWINYNETMKTVKMNIRVNKDIKEKAEKVFDSLGLTNSQAVNMFFIQVILNNGIPFDIKIPSYYDEKTIKVIEDSENR